MYLMYWLVGFIATSLGAVAGLGGGVIIKPVLDSVGMYDIATVGLLSSVTVLAMASISLAKSIKQGVKFQGKQSVMIALGSIVGGNLGKILLRSFINLCEGIINPNFIISILLAGIMIIAFTLILMKDKIKRYALNDLKHCMAVGVILGAMSSFLGIGGGPINVVIFVILFSMDTKRAALHSILIIFFSQFSGLINIYMGSGFSRYNLEMIWVMIAGGISGGYLGSHFSKKMKEEHIRWMFNVTMVFIIGLNLFNALSAVNI